MYRVLICGLRVSATLVLGIALSGLALGSSGKLPAFPEDPKSHHWEKVGTGVYAFISPIGITPIVSGNSLVVIGDDAVVVVDTGQFPSLARAEIAEIQRLTPLPVRYIVTTHWHPDHWAGNGEFVRAYPGVSIIATENTRTLSQSHGAPYVAPEYPGKILEAIGKALARGTHSDGKPLLASELPYIEMAKIQFRGFGPELASTVLVYPNLVFNDALDLHLGKRLVQVRFLGRGNTGGDAVVYVPDAKVLAAGDLVVSPYPYGTGSFYGEWLTTLRTLAAIDAQIIVPGHGEVEHDKSYLLRLTHLLETVQTRVSASVNAGSTLEATQKKVALADVKAEFCGGRDFQTWCESSFDNNFVVPAVTRTYKEQNEGPLQTED
jgi:glyoxylase-like metal-dependent hydrolase (beta-lactamase superfamily II)